MKKVRFLIIAFICSIIFVPSVNAATGSINVKANNKTVVVGNTTKVTVTVSSSDLGAWEYCISYDSSILKLESSTANANTCVKGVIKLNENSETFTFKALKSGSTNVTVKSYAIYSYETEQQMNTTPSSVKITTMTQKELEATYSTNANLKSLSVGDYKLSPSFDKSTLEYEVEVPNEVTSVVISASKEDSTAEISGTGTKDLTEGDNKFEITVTAQKGNSKTYKVNVYRKELDPIKVEVDGSDYFIVRKKDALPQYPTFEETTVTIDGEEVPALHSSITDYTIVGLKDSDSKIVMFIYENGKYTRYEEIKSNALTVYPQELPKEDSFSEYEVVEVEYDGIKIEGYALSKSSNFVIIYAQNIETGDVKYYSYDKKNNTIQEYDSELTEKFNEKIKLYKYIILGFIGFTILLLLIIIFRRPKKKIIVKEDFVDEVKKDELDLESERKKIEAEIESELANIKKDKEVEHKKEIQLIEEVDEVVEENTNNYKNNNQNYQNNNQQRKKKKKNKNRNSAVNNVQPIEIEIKEEPKRIEVEEKSKKKDSEKEGLFEIKITKEDKTVELKEFSNEVNQYLEEDEYEKEITEAYKKMDLVDEDSGLSKREMKKKMKKLRKEEKARLKEF